jgi:hypothetical protein
MLDTSHLASNVTETNLCRVGTAHHLDFSQFLIGQYLPSGLS